MSMYNCGKWYNSAMTTFSNTSKNPLSWEAPVVSITDYFLLIDDSNFFLIDDTYKLKIQGSVDTKRWTTVSRNPLSF